MGKGNFVMSQVRGKIGSLVFSRVKGQQVIRSHNDAPKNPRSARQMLQRSQFEAAVKFFTRGRQAFFKFAFEGKKQKESDYNAFMSQNIALATHMSKAAFDEPTYPSIAPFIMTKGSLNELPVELNAGKTAFELTVSGLAEGATVGALSQGLIDTYGLQRGDIITLCIIVANGSTAENTPAIEPDKRDRVSWNIVQFLLDETSEATIASVLGTEAAAAAGALTITPASMATAACACCLTASRNTPEGVRVSTTQLCLNDIANTIYEASQEESYIKDVLNSWGASQDAILQGSLVQ